MNERLKICIEEIARVALEDPSVKSHIGHELDLTDEELDDVSKYLEELLNSQQDGAVIHDDVLVRELLNELSKANGDSMVGMASLEFGKWNLPFFEEHLDLRKRMSDSDFNLMHIGFAEGFCVGLTKKLMGEV